jgi:hypothetical protein
MHSNAELNLLWAIIERSVLDVQGNKAEEKRNAWRWIFLWDDQDHDHDFTFPWCCDHLGLCPFEVRAVIKRSLARSSRLTHPSYRHRARSWEVLVHQPESATEMEVYFG